MRLVVLGFEDERILSGKVTTDTPTVSRGGGRIILQIGLSNAWKIWSADISTAFLQGEPLDKPVLQHSEGGEPEP